MIPYWLVSCAVFLIFLFIVLSSRSIVQYFVRNVSKHWRRTDFSWNSLVEGSCSSILSCTKLRRRRRGFLHGSMPATHGLRNAWRSYAHRYCCLSIEVQASESFLSVVSCVTSMMGLCDSGCHRRIAASGTGGVQGVLLHRCQGEAREDRSSSRDAKGFTALAVWGGKYY